MRQIMSIQQTNVQNNNAKIDVTGKVHPLQSPSHISTFQCLGVDTGGRLVRVFMMVVDALLLTLKLFPMSSTVMLL